MLFALAVAEVGEPTATEAEAEDMYLVGLQQHLFALLAQVVVLMLMVDLLVMVHL
jgi:hypothetical protein